MHNIYLYKNVIMQPCKMDIDNFFSIFLTSQSFHYKHLHIISMMITHLS